MVGKLTNEDGPTPAPRLYISCGKIVGQVLFKKPTVESNSMSIV